jgi:hypothetical protein
MATKKKEEQPFLFGEIDQIYNALETERTMLNSEIKEQNRKIDRCNVVITILSERRDNLSEAISLTKLKRDVLKDKEK